MAKSCNDQLFKKKREKSFSRKPPNKPPKERILIVCEGEATEPNYFKVLRDYLGLDRNNIKIFGKECGSAPSSVYEYAIQEWYKDGDYDRAYCVFDKDTHACYAETLDKTKRNKKEKIIAINSVPCFEFWVLLHFDPTASPFKSSAEIAKRIKNHWKEYDKEKIKDLYLHLKDKTDVAIKNAKQVSASDHGDNPSTKVHVLVEDLIKQSKK